MKNEKNNYGRHYLIVIAGCLIMMGGTGIVFSVTALFVPQITEAFQIGKGTFTLWLTIALLTAFVTLPFAGKLFARKSSRMIIALGGLLTGGCQILFSFAKSVWFFYILAVPIGLGMSILGYVAVPTLLNRWFKEKVGFFTGICMAFTGVGGVVFSQVAGKVIGTYGWRFAYVVLGICTIVLTIPFTLAFVRDYPSDLGLLPYGKEENTAGEAGTASPGAVAGVSLSVAKKTAAFYLLMIFTCLMSFGSSIYQYIASYVLTLPVGATVGIAATIGSIVMFSQAFGKILLGYLGDKNLKACIALSVVCAVVSLLILWLIPVNAVLIYIASFLFGIFYSTTLVVAPIMCRTLFGVKDFSVIYSRFSMLIVLSAAISVSLLGFIVDGTGSFTSLWIIGIAIAVVACSSGFTSLKQGEKMKWAEQIEA